MGRGGITPPQRSGGGGQPAQTESAEANERVYDKADFLKQFILRNYLFGSTEEELNNGMLQGMFQALGDKYSAYLDQDQFKALQEDNAGAFGGIGVTVSPNEEDNLITVVAPIRDTPGDRAGLRTNDKIIKVNGEEFFADTMDAAIKVMRGEPGTDVTITVRRLSTDAPPEEFDLTITREMINIISAEGSMLEDGLGYVTISSFDENTEEYFKKAMETVESQGAKGVVLDLRNNPGGLLDVVSAIADDLLPEGVIVTTRGIQGDETVEKSGSSHNPIPMVVLVNNGSASASEILAGAIQDYDRAPIIGVTTFGKGIVQRIIPLDDGSGFKLTVSEYFTPKDRKIHEIGVVPDIEVDLPEDQHTFGPEVLEQDLQLQKAIETLKEQLNR